MGFYTMLAVGLGIFVAFLLVVGAMYPGNGSDLLDYDPAGRAAKKILAEAEDMDQMTDLHHEQQQRAEQRAERRDSS